MASTETTSTPSHARPWLWVGALVIIAISAGAIAAIMGPLRDPDVYWHIRLGGEPRRCLYLRRGARLVVCASPIQLGIDPMERRDSVPSRLNQLAGFSGLIAYRTVTTVLTLVTLGLVIFRQTRVWAAVLVFPLPVATLFILPRRGHNRCRSSCS